MADYPNDILTFLIGIIVILTTIVGVFKWQITQIKNNTRRDTTTLNDTHENHKDINQLKEIILTLQTKISELCDRISKMEGAFTQHNREAKKD